MRAAASATFVTRAARVSGRRATAIQPSSVFRAEGGKATKLTAAGGWRIIKTLGHKVVKLQPIHGFTAQTTAAAVIQLASHWGIPLSTTQVISTCIMGVGATKRLSAVKWGVVGQILWAWTLTLPVTVFLAYWIERGLLLIP